MKKSRLPEEQIIFASKQAESDMSVPDVYCKLGISDATFKAWCKRYGETYPSKLNHMRQRQEENLLLKRLVADLGLDKAMQQDVLAKKS
ncbi:transposase [Pantoea ananatis]|uniref:transposase n=1 Tax=Pantoea ananas TaxID=553 RepID=UPI0002DFF785